jgi:group II intron reverse transcriptase/maturase
VQRKLYQWSRDNPDDAYRKLWSWTTDLRNLRCAWRHVASNKGRRSPGVDGMTVSRIVHAQGQQAFVHELQSELRAGSYRPMPCRRRLIPKRGKPGELRALGIPTVKDRVVQCAVKQVLEPLFEAQFRHVSYGFRPGRNCHGALEHLRLATTPRARKADGTRSEPPYAWVLEGDIKSCFDQIGHHGLMTRLRRRVADRRVERLVLRFLKAGVLSKEQFIATRAGTPQGGVISPLLANIALSAIEERYERWVHYRPARTASVSSDGQRAAHTARAYDRGKGRMVCFPIRYADDFVVCVHGSRQQAEAEKDALAEQLRQDLGLELSADKTRVTSIWESFVFLGHRVRLKRNRAGYYTSLEVPKARVAELRRRIKGLTARSTTSISLEVVLTRLNQTLRGWGNFYRHCYGVYRVFGALDEYATRRLRQWLHKKMPKVSGRQIMSRYGRRTRDRTRRKVWHDGAVGQFLLTRLPREGYRLQWMRRPDYAMTSGEPDA